MPDQSPQPSAFVFPVALEPALAEESLAAQIASRGERWGWIELFVLTQVFWGILLFMPGSQAFRAYIRAAPYVASLLALLACLRSGATDVTVPGARWIVAVIVLLVFNLLHSETWLMSGTAQVVFQLAIAAPIFWGARAWITERRLERFMLLIFGAHFISTALGLLQVYYPATFLPPEFSLQALRFNPEFVSALSYVGAAERVIIRPPGLSDLPGGAAISGTITALLAFVFAMRARQTKLRRALFFGAAAVATTVVYLTQVRSLLIMIPVGVAVLAGLRLRKGQIAQTGWIATAAGVLIVGSFIWAVTLGGESVQQRFNGIVDSGVVQSYRENRGVFLDYTIREVPFMYPLGAGLGRWGMMTTYFGEDNWQHPALYAEIQPTGWAYDGGILMWILYPGALIVAMKYAYKLAINLDNSLNDYAEMVLVIQMLVVGLCFTGPVFNTQIGIMFWLTTALLAGAYRTQILEVWSRSGEGEDPEQEDPEDEDQSGETSDGITRFSSD